MRQYREVTGGSGLRVVYSQEEADWLAEKDSEREARERREIAVRQLLNANGTNRVPVARLSIDEIRNPPREQFVIGNMIPLAKSSVLYGPTSVGKSALAAQIVFSFAAGARFLWGLPLFPGGGPVLIYTTEDSLDDWKRKAAAALCGGAVNMERAVERIQIIDQSEGIARLVESVTVRASDVASQRVMRPTEEQVRIIAAAREMDARLVLVETTSRLVDEEDNATFSALQSALGRIARLTNAAVLLTHHATKAASKDNDSAIESARGGGSLIANARNAIALYPAKDDVVKRYRGQFPAEDICVLTHGKPTSSTRRQAPLELVRTDATWGAVFRTPDDVKATPEQEQANTERMEAERHRELALLRRLYEVVEKALPMQPSLSPSQLRDHFHKEIGVAKNGPHGVVWLVGRALELGVLREHTRNQRGITIALGHDPRKPIAASEANTGGSSPGAS